MSETIYITTPIYYVNDKPHIGHAYTTLLADILARHHRTAGRKVFFLTGTDEHGQKVEKAAKERGVDPQAHCDEMVVRFQKLWEKLEITNDDFIRTTEPRHVGVVQEILQDLYDRGLIYKSEYSGRYCVPCERFFTEKDLGEGGTCPDCGRTTDEIMESNYFFKMGQYQDWLVEHIKSHPDFILPPFRANETLGFLKRPLDDLCISRPKSRLAWGIELPFDKDYVCYVWFDALVNYISAAGYRSDDAKFADLWPASIHLIGKDILTTHTVYWPTMLKAMGVEQPKTVFAHGWWLSGTGKMSKSAGNVVNPMDMIEIRGVDAFRYFLAAEMSLGQDAVFSEEAFVARYNSDLANDLGNLVSRAVKLVERNCGGEVPAPGAMTELERNLAERAVSAAREMDEAVGSMKLDRGIAAVMNAVREGNRYMERTAPWKLAKEDPENRLGTVLHSVVELLRIATGLLAPVMPGKMKTIRTALGIAGGPADSAPLDEWGTSAAGAKIKDAGPVFPRIDTKKTADSAKPAKQKEKKKMEKSEKEETGLISIDEFFKAKLKTAKVLEAEKVEGADRLLKLKIDLGDERRQIVAGIAQFRSPEEMTGKTIVVVSNLKPAKIRGIESNGMLLAAKKPDGALAIVTLDDDTPPGCSVG
jgi:methionyl-tRNA synthetase